MYMRIFALVFVILLFPLAAEAQTIKMESGAISTWGDALDPGNLIDPLINNKLSGIAILSAWRLTEPLNDSLFAEDTEETATGILGAPAKEFSFEYTNTRFLCRLRCLYG